MRCIGNIDQDVTFTPPDDLTYDGNVKAATVESTDRDFCAITIKYYDQNGEVSPIDAGVYTVKIDISASEKYDAISGYDVGRFTILQAQNVFINDLSIEGWTYGDTPNSPTAEAKFGTPTYSYSTEKDGTYTTEQPTNAGTYWVKATVDETENYTGLEAKKQFTILPKIYTVTYDAGSNGTGTVTAGSKTHDVAFILSSETFTRAGYEQTGWAVSDGGEKVYNLGGTYTENKEITLYPVWSDITNPTGEISIGTNNWTTFLEEITFGMFFKDTQTVTITANDNSGEAVTIGYLLSDNALTLGELAAATFDTYDGEFTIAPDREFVVYAKLTDTSGNVVYIDSNGIVLDAAAPVISGIENGKTYCSEQTFTVTETYLDKVTVNGVEVTLDESNQYTLDPAEGTQTITVTDKAGNKAEMAVTVNDGYRGGEATCKDKAVCGYCGEEYGEPDSTNHNLEKVPAKVATVTETGNIEYWHCLDCGKYFADENGENEIELADTVISKLPPEIIEGKGQSITEGEKKALSFTSNAAFSDFIRVELDGKTLDEKNYTVKEGSTVVTLKADYVATLSAGEHTIGIVSESGTATTTFTVNEKAAVDNDTKSLQTGDNSHMALWIALLAASVFGFAGTAVYSKRKRVR